MRWLLVVACVAVTARAGAQGLPSEPISVANGRFVFGGEMFATVGGSDPGWFNYTDYEYNALRNVRASLTAAVRVTSRAHLLSEIRFDHGERLSAYALFLRLRPWPTRRFDIQVGRVPPTFGAFTRTVYAYDNLVIGQPLAYQYLLSLRTSAVPASVDDLVAMRARGWRSRFAVGDRAAAPGVPMVNTLRFDTGVQVHGVVGSIEWTGAVTQGSLSDPLVTDNNARPQVAGRVQVRVQPSLRVGTSVASGPWLDESLDEPLGRAGPARRFRQSAIAVDAELSHGRWLARGEWIRSSWQLPALAAPGVPEAPVARAWIVEGRYRLAPGLSLAARGDALAFSEVTTSTGPRPWEARVRRFETALGASVTRNAVVRLAWQRNWRDGGLVRRETLLAGQLLYWF